MSDEALFSWVHISDIHFGHGGAGYAANQSLVLEELQSDIAARKPARVDAILVTGDIAFSGNAVSSDEYPRARKWLLATGEAAGVGPTAIYLVPGNHDVNRGADADPSVGPLVQSLREGTRSMDEVLGKAAERALLAQRQAAYLELAKDFGPWAGSSAIPPAEERLYWSKAVAGQGGLVVRFAGLNTALLAKDQDEKKLSLGERQIEATLPPTKPGELVVVLSHHPFRSGWLADETSMDQWARRRAHVHLSGHVHEAQTEYAGSGAGSSFVRVVAGAAHGERLPAAWLHASHGYSFGEVRRRGEALVLRVYPRLWSEENKTFVRDVHGVPEGSDYAEHALGVTLPAPVASIATSRAALPSGPLPTFISYAPADRQALDRLAVHLKQLGPKRDKLIDAWSAAHVGAGEEGKKATAEHLGLARVILLLISPDYLASDDCYDEEMMTAVARHERGEAAVIPILLKGCDYASAPFKRLLFALQPHHDAPPAAVYGRGGDPEEAFAAIAASVRRAVEELRKRTRSTA